MGRVTGRPVPVATGQAIDVVATVDVSAVGHVQVHLQLADIAEQLAQLTGFVNRLSANLANVEAQIHTLRRAIEQARSEARAGDTQMLAEAKAAVGRFSDQLSHSQVLDLRYAIAGVGFSILGAALNFCT